MKNVSSRLTNMGRNPKMLEHGLRAQSAISERRELDRKASDTNLIVRVTPCGAGGISSWLGFQRRDLAPCSICHVCWLVVEHLGLGDSSCLTFLLRKEDANCSYLVTGTVRITGMCKALADQRAHTWP